MHLSIYLPTQNQKGRTEQKHLRLLHLRLLSIHHLALCAEQLQSLQHLKTRAQSSITRSDHQITRKITMEKKTDCPIWGTHLPASGPASSACAPRTPRAFASSPRSPAAVHGASVQLYVVSLRRKRDPSTENSAKTREIKR
jgi:hypothetical protein